MCRDVSLQIGASYHQTNVSVWVVDLEVSTSGYKCGPNLDTLFCVEVFIEFYVYTPIPSISFF